MKPLLSFLGVLLLACVIAQANEPNRGQPAEIKLDRYEIYPTSITEPTPVGLVDKNPPFLHFQKAYADAKLTLVIGPWKIRAEMDASRPSLLTATDDQTAAILTGSAAESISFRGKTCRAEPKGATVLVEKKAAVWTVYQAVDRLPDAALFSNRP